MTQAITIDELEADMANLLLLLSAEKDYLAQCDHQENEDLQKAAALNGYAVNHARQILEKIEAKISVWRGQ